MTDLVDACSVPNLLVTSKKLMCAPVMYAQLATSETLDPSTKLYRIKIRTLGVASHYYLQAQLLLSLVEETISTAQTRIVGVRSS